MAEVAGFEPAPGYSPVDGLANRCDTVPLTLPNFGARGPIRTDTVPAAGLQPARVTHHDFYPNDWWAWPDSNQHNRRFELRTFADYVTCPQKAKTAQPFG